MLVTWLLRTHRDFLMHDWYTTAGSRNLKRSNSHLKHLGLCHSVTLTQRVVT